MYALQYVLHAFGQVIELTRQQEVTKQQESKSKEAEYQAQAQRYAIVSSPAILNVYTVIADTAYLDICRGITQLDIMTMQEACDVSAHAHCCTGQNSPVWIVYFVMLVLPQERERVHWEEQRKAMQADQYNKAELARYEDELARKRAEAEHEKGRARQLELVRLQEESAAKLEARKVEVQAQIEAERRATEQYRVCARCHTDVCAGPCANAACSTPVEHVRLGDSRRVQPVLAGVWLPGLEHMRAVLRAGCPVWVVLLWEVWKMRCPMPGVAQAAASGRCCLHTTEELRV